ncbi:DUF3465 domain-containing protein [Stenotrophobium rhamnosiphilum]|uniref:DUF3465 domain-containing protein n=1 Tax=Stenotrophobium rhamnosiphilum TaxID=2029166 RepID=A0A2T5MEG7_9GAMM|nr:DUF3465 domain-containing protein [Stenotrophobium rhamnosiphilum]PTU30974.1 hypothetical protein CJD38_11760 [Stenotrophobium rhamnosiphilum]
MKNLILIGALIAGAYFWFGEGNHQGTSTESETQSLSGPSSFGQADSNRQVQGEGVVVKVLPDDNEGSRHQKFILELSSGQTILVAHNIDLAPRISSISQGDTIAFNGEYEWNEKGGVVHWTHHDPGGRHEAGWLKAGGKTYQ